MGPLGRRWFGLGGLLIAFSVGVGATEKPVPPAEPAAAIATESPDYLKPEAVPSFPVVRVVLTLALLMGALYFVRPLLKKTKWGGAPVGGPGLDILSRAYLGPKAGICLVQAEGRKFLVGVGADGVRLLADFGARPGEAPSRE